jgi:hypothetical protein
VERGYCFLSPWLSMKTAVAREIPAHDAETSRSQIERRISTRKNRNT